MEELSNTNEGINPAESYEKPQPLPLRGSPPRRSSTLNKRTVRIGIAVLCAGIGIAVLQSFSFTNSKPRSVPDSIKTISPGELVQGLPSDYSAIKKPVPKLGPPLKGEIGATQLAFQQEQSKVSPEEQFEKEQKFARLKRAVLAHGADVTFPGLSSTIEKKGNDTSGNSGFAESPQLPLSISQNNLNPRDDDNRQDEKQAFISQSHQKDQVLLRTLQDPLSPYQLMAGTVISGVLLSGVNSDLPGQILGQVSQNVFDTRSGKYLLIPQGAKVIGEYDSRISYGQERVLVVWIRLVLPNGKSISLEGMPGVDLSGYAGLKERVNNHYGKLLSGVVFGSLLGAGAQVAQGSRQSVDPSFGQLALEGTAQNINQAGQQITRKNLNIQPTIEISPGQRFNIFVTKDAVFERYE